VAKWDAEKIKKAYEGLSATQATEHDSVNYPAHYNKGNIRCIDYVKDLLTEEGYIGYLQGNIAKYLHRWRDKNGLEDLKKAQWYTAELVRVVEEKTP
jgi:hypothetical protein